MFENDEHYDVFISYAHSDDDDSQKWVPKLTNMMEVHYRRLTGHSLKIFHDTSNIGTAQLWEERISSGLENSTILIAILSPTYFTSDWCGKEWDHFIALENERRDTLALTDDQGLIFPLRLIDWSRVRKLNDDQLRRITEAERRQYTSFENIEPGTVEFDKRVKKLIDDIDELLCLVEDGLDDVSKKMMKKKKPQVVPEPIRPVTRIGTNLDEFLDRLSQAINVTIIGNTNQNLAQYLEEALARKRKKDSNDFWQTLQIIFLGDSLLDAVDDELKGGLTNPNQANLKRRMNAGQAKRAITRVLIRAKRPHQWDLYEYNSVLPFVGAMFEMPNGRKMVQIATLRPGYNMSEHLFFEFSNADMAAEVAYYQAAFQAIIDHSVKHEEIVLLGCPSEEGFLVTNAKFRRTLLEPDYHNNDWIAATIVILWQEESGKAYPLLQIRTKENSTREIGMLSNLCGYVNMQDCLEIEKSTDTQFLLPEPALKNTISRELREELGDNIEFPSGPVHVTESRFYYPDKENLYFYVYQVQIKLNFGLIHQSAKLSKWSFKEILRVREYQVLANAVKFLDIDLYLRRCMHNTAQVLADNLILHMEPDLAKSLTDSFDKEQNMSFDKLKYEIRQSLNYCQTNYEFRGQSHHVLGLAGFQYREFFALLVPLYAEIGVEGAKEYKEWIENEPTARSALLRLQQHYASEDAIRNIQLDV